MRKPDSVSHEEAAALLFGGTTALHFLREKASVQPGETVLVNGASGAVGTSAVQLAAHLSATVTAVTSARNAELVRGLGAARVVDYAQTPATTLTDRFDVVLDTVGNLSPATGSTLLRPGGRLVLVAADLPQTLRAQTMRNVIAGVAQERPADFGELLQLAGAGDLHAVIDRCLPLDEIAAAHRLVDSGHKVGAVIVRPWP